MKPMALLFCVLAFAFTKCAGPRTAQQESVALGWIEQSVLLENPEHEDFRARYDTVTIDPRLTTMMRTLSEGADFVVVLGTWCSDSRREVPRFLKAVDAAGIPAGRIRLYGVDRSKKSNDGVTDTYRIERVPTFIVLKGGKEIGRVVEMPVSTVEGDVIAILAGSGGG